MTAFDAWFKLYLGIARQPIARMMHVLLKERYFHRLVSRDLRVCTLRLQKWLVCMVWTLGEAHL